MLNEYCANSTFKNLYICCVRVGVVAVPDRTRRGRQGDGPVGERAAVPIGGEP